MREREKGELECPPYSKASVVQVSQPMGQKVHVGGGHVKSLKSRVRRGSDVQ